MSAFRERTGAGDGLGPTGEAAFGLLEVLVALVLLEVGLLGCAGMLVLAQRHLTTAQRVHQATKAAASAADSLLAAGALETGLAREEWGTLR